jgi:hypothetical protein
MEPGTPGADFARVESVLGVRITAEHRALLAAANGWAKWYGDHYLMVYGTDELIAVNKAMENHAGFLAFASDGGRELIGLDMRVSTPPVVMIDITSAGWEEALFQAESLPEFMEQRARHEDFRWDTPYEARS